MEINEIRTSLNVPSISTYPGWTWTCAGSNGGSTATCSANKKIDGECGSSNREILDSEPNTNLCLAGIASDIDGDGPWTWTCEGINGGTSAECSALSEIEENCMNNYTRPVFWTASSSIRQGSALSVGNGKYLGRNGSTLYIPWSIYAGHSGTIRGTLTITATITCGSATYNNTTGIYYVDVNSMDPITPITFKQYHNGSLAPSLGDCNISISNMQMTASFPQICS